MQKLKLRDYRKNASMTQKQVAELMNVTQSAYSLWELGKRVPDANQILRLCHIFKCTPNDLFGIPGVLQVEYGQYLNKNKK